MSVVSGNCTRSHGSIWSRDCPLPVRAKRQLTGSAEANVVAECVCVCVCVFCFLSPDVTELYTWLSRLNGVTDISWT